MTTRDNLRVEQVYFENLKRTMNELAAKKSELDGTMQTLAENAVAADENIIMLYKNLCEAWIEAENLFKKVDTDTQAITERIDSLEKEFNEKIDEVNNYIVSITRALDERLTQAEEDIDSLEGRMDTAEGDIDALEGRMTTAEGNIADIIEVLQHTQQKPKSWAELQQMVRDDVAKNFILVRDQFECGYNTNDTLLFDVLDINHDIPTDTTKTKSLTLQTHYTLDNTRIFSSREAFYVFTETAIAGKYYFVIDNQPYYPGDVGKIFEFELTTATIPAGAQLVMQQDYNATANGASVKLYLAPGNSTEVETATMAEVLEPTVGAINLGTINRTKQSNLNCIDRALLGNNNWKESLIRQWLNSDGNAGTWWTAQNIWDRPASWVSTTPGFMSYLDADFKSVIGRTHVITIRNASCDGGGIDETDDYFFLISREEAYNGPENAEISEGSPYAFYRDYASSSRPSTASDPNRVKRMKGSIQGQYWWYRTPFYNGNSSVRCSNTNGGITDGYYSISTRGVSPACNII